MADRATRDFQLVEVSDACMNTVAGNAMATICVLQKTAGERARQGRQVELVKEMVARFVDHTVTLQTAMIDYRPDMTEAELRSWAAWIYAEVTGR